MHEQSDLGMQEMEKTRNSRATNKRNARASRGQSPAHRARVREPTVTYNAIYVKKIVRNAHDKVKRRRAPGGCLGTKSR